MWSRVILILLIFFTSLCHSLSNVTPFYNRKKIRSPLNKTIRKLPIMNVSTIEDPELKQYVEFLRKNKKVVVFNPLHKNENNVYYNISFEKVQSLGNFTFESEERLSTAKKIIFQIPDNAKEIQWGNYVACPIEETVHIPATLFSNDTDLFGFSLQITPNQHYLFDNKTIGITGNVDVSCQLPTLFLPSKILFHGVIEDMKRWLKLPVADFEKMFL